MGFGSGYSSRTKRGGKSYNNQMAAHVWAAQSESEGQSNNGNLFFRGRTLYSYGTHFVVGFVMPDGLAFLNADSYSVSTSGHQSDASQAVRNSRTCRVAGLTNLAGDWKLLPKLARFLETVAERGATAAERKEIQAAMRHSLLEYAEELAAPIMAPGEYSYGKDTSANQAAGAYLAHLAGLPAATWPKLAREAAKAKAKRESVEAAKQAELAERRALRLTDMSGKDWREYLARLGTDYSDSGFVQLAKELRRARKLAMAAKRGKLATAGRLATIRARLKQVEAERDTFAAKRQPRLDRAELAVHLASVRNWRDATEDGRAASANYHGLASLVRAAEHLAERGRLAALKTSAAKMAWEVRIGQSLVAAEAERLAEIERQYRAKSEEERRQLWLSGAPVGRVYFDAETGGAALRIIGDTLETSHGASVPLAHAVKVFRFVKLCKERGESWHRNGKTIRVGHFQVDSISSDGSFRAGCHSFTWPEVERAAALAGVASAAPSAEAVEPTAHAA